VIIDSIEKCGIDIVHGCQLRCVGCPNSTLKPKIKHMLLETFSACLDNIDVRRVELMRLFNFGEPLLHPDVPGILERVRDARFELGAVEISTNAQYHDFEMLAEIFRTRVLTRMAVSCDGDGTPEEYERLRPPSRWKKLIEFLHRAAEYRDRYAPSTPLITRTICQSRKAQVRWRELLEPIGWTPTFRGWLALPEAKENHSGISTMPTGLCSFVQKPTLYVDYDGSVVPCCAHPRASLFGNLTKQPFSELYFGPARLGFVDELERNRRNMPICNACSLGPLKEESVSIGDVSLQAL
jgi:MoaA/NifB/PqqE/SkfB family radical SAM enzyme